MDPVLENLFARQEKLAQNVVALSKKLQLSKLPDDFNKYSYHLKCTKKALRDTQEAIKAKVSSPIHSVM